MHTARHHGSKECILPIIIVPTDMLATVLSRSLVKGKN